MQERFHLESLYTAVRITDFHYVTAEAGWSYPDHKHTVLEFQYCVSGVLPLHVDGESCMLQPGEAAVILPGLYHRTEPLPGDCEYFVFHFHLESDRVNAAFLLLDRPHLRPGFGVDPDRHIPNWIDRFLAEYGDSLPGKRAARSVAGAEDARQALFYLRLQARLLEFIGILGETIVREAERRPARHVQPAQSNLAREAAYRMESQFPAPLRIGELADRLGVHRSYLCDCFKKVYGMPPQAYIRSLHIRQAKALLQDTALSVEQIAERLHFSSSAHFCRAFRQATGTTPARYRRS